MLKVDLSNVWGDLSLPDLLATEQEVFAAHKTLAEGRGPGNDFLGWLELPTFEETEELQRIRRAPVPAPPRRPFPRGPEGHGVPGAVLAQAGCGAYSRQAGACAPPRSSVPCGHGYGRQHAGRGAELYLQAREKGPAAGIQVPDEDYPRIPRALFL